jgi:DNA-directed RNA polymerase subunit alpha
LFEIVVPKVEVIAKSENHGTFQLEPLEPGFGITIGNALRRVLLSSLPGAAVNSIRVDGVYHEFTDIPGVREDVAELVLNVKQLRLRSTIDHPEPLRMEAKGIGRLTGADVYCPPEVEIVNPEQYLMSIDDSDAAVNIEFTVQRGKGYVPADQREGMPIGVIPVDAIFTPIKKVNYAIEETRIGVTTYERLILDVWTDGTIDPEAAVAQSADIMIDQMRILSELVGKPEPIADKQARATAAIPSQLYDIPIEDLDLSVRAYNCLKRASITKVGQVLEMSEDDLLSVRNFGHKSLDELKESLETRGYFEGSRLAASSMATEEEAEEPEVEGETLSEGEQAIEAEDEEEEEEEEETLPETASLPEEEEEEAEEEAAIPLDFLTQEEDEEEAPAEAEAPALDQRAAWSESDWQDEEEEIQKRPARRRRTTK